MDGGDSYTRGMSSGLLSCIIKMSRMVNCVLTYVLLQQCWATLRWEKMSLEKLISAAWTVGAAGQKAAADKGGEDQGALSSLLPAPWAPLCGASVLVKN